MNWSSLKIHLVALCIGGTFASVFASAETPSKVNSFLKNQCVDCHAGDSAEGGFDVTALSRDLANADVFEKWVRVADRVRDGEMPPPDSAELSEEDRDAFVSASLGWLGEHERKDWEQNGRVRGRRLTNLQLERSLHSVLGIDIPLASRMPDEPKANGFTTVADGQSMSHFQLEKHLSIIDLALDDAFERAVDSVSLERRDLDGKALSRNNPRRRTREPEVIDGLAVTWASRLIFYGRLPATTAKKDGWYQFTVRAKALKSPKDHGVWCTVRTGRCVSSAPLLNWVGAFEAKDDVQEWTFEAWMPKGEMLEIRPGDDTLKMARFAGGQVGTGEGGPQDVPGVAIENIVMQQIHKGQGDEGIKDILFGELELKQPTRKGEDATLVSEQPWKDIRSLMETFAERAFRSPVEFEEIEEYVSMAQQSYQQSHSLISALRTGYRALLCSPRFLYFTEQPGELDDYAVASRLSYFLWNAPPDQQLLALASEGKLRDQQVIAEQVERMLDDPKGKEFVPDLAAQWLDLSEINFTTPDRRLYPDFDVVVEQSMVRETETYLQEMLDKDLSVSRIIDSKDGFLNERLARYYGIEGLSGDEMQKVSFDPNDQRGGLLTQGAIMKVTANGSDTSPVLRGVWISERLLGVDIPPPPTNVPAIEPDIRGATTIREMLEKHKSSESCASCHVKIDPPGFALENFDPAGRWRERYLAFEGRKRVRGPEIDPGFVLPDGREFDSLEEFQQLILSDPAKIAGNVARKLMTYGTGAPISVADRVDVQHIVGKTAEDDYGFRSIVKAVATSPTFLNK